MWFEYSNVLNQVYQSYHPTHIYTHRGFPIGHYLGNDFNNLRIHYSHLIMSGQIKPFIDISYLLDGSNGLDTLFDNPWENEKGDFFEDFQQGGKDRIQKFCAMHDFSSTYQFEVA